MLETAVSIEPPWPDTTDWEALALRAASAALERTPQGEMLTSPALIEISIRLTTDGEVRTLNAQYRHKDRPTNVLSFPMVQADLLDTIDRNSDDGEVLLGDIVLAHGVCASEAAARGIALDQHATHLIVHGTLHLLGYDHDEDHQAEAMEAIEIAALAALGLPDPYLITED